MKFSEMGLSERTMSAINEMKYENATPIQEQAIPLLMQGEDLIGQAQTGTGKTAAFSIPILERWLHASEAERPKFTVGVASPYALIMTPTRELAIQVAQSFATIGKYSGVISACLYGGQEIDRQTQQFERKVDIVIGTPGRLLDHIERGTLNLEGCRMVVLDEADRMLDMGFADDVIEIMNKTIPGRQTMLFSATMPREIVNLAHEYMKSPQMVKVSEDKITVDKIKQCYVPVDGQTRLGYLLGALKNLTPKLAVIFVRTKFGADKLNRILRDRGFESDCLHGDMSQKARDSAMKKFREGKLHVLVATDLAARGLDVFDVSHVFNYDLPEDPLTYVHRIGRTGRMGNEGVAISFVFEDQLPWLEAVVQLTKVPIDKIVIEYDNSRPMHSHPSGEGERREGGYARRAGGFGHRREGGHSHSREGSRGGRGGSGYGSHSREGGHGSRGGHPSSRFGSREGGRSRPGFGGRDSESRGGSASGQTMRMIQKRARQGAKTHFSTRGGNYSGRQS